MSIPIMPAIASDKRNILKRAVELQAQLDAMQEELRGLLRGAGSLQVTLPELHDDASGRINAQRLATYLGVPLKSLAEGLQLNYKALHRSPSADAVAINIERISAATAIKRGSECGVFIGPRVYGVPPDNRCHPLKNSLAIRLQMCGLGRGLGRTTATG